MNARFHRTALALALALAFATVAGGQEQPGLRVPLQLENDGNRPRNSLCKTPAAKP